ncbi:MAG: TonB family protein [Candidatus Omnitrophota bacterium]
MGIDIKKIDSNFNLSHLREIAEYRRQFNVILVVSILIHYLFLVALPHLKIMPSRKALANLEVTYQKLKSEETVSKKLLQTIEKRLIDNSPLQQKTSPDVSKVANPPPFIDKPTLSETKIHVRKAPTPTIIGKSLKEIVRLPQVSSPVMKNPAYVSYYQVVRDKIKSVAFLNSTIPSGGEVFLSFVLDADGQLLAIQIIDDRSIDNPQLRNLAYNFIKQAAPFPQFPRELKHPKLSFNVIIEFKITD